MFLKIYFSSAPLFLCDKIEPVIEPYLHHDDAVFIDELNPHTVKSMIHEMQLEKVHAGVFLHPDLVELKKAFFRKFTLIQAAGGIIYNEKDEVLMIYRRGKWDLPKGKLDEGESLEQCAIREVMEETGVTGVTIEGPARITYHTYHEGTKFILKESHWFPMKINGEQQLTPQTEEDISEIVWASPAALPRYLENTYPMIPSLLNMER